MTDDAEGAGDHEPPTREEFSHDPVPHAAIEGGMTVGELVQAYGDAGLGAESVHEAADVLSDMFTDEECTVLMSLAGAMVPGGMRRVVTGLVRDGHIDALVTTGATLTHDAIEAIGGKHHHGRERGSGSLREHDERLRDEQVDRIYNVYLPQEHFAGFESHLRKEVFPPLEHECEASGAVGIADLTRELGRANAMVNDRDGVEEDPGLAAAAYDADVPIYCPAVADSVLGLQAWMYSQTSAFSLDALSDMSELNDLAFDAERAGCFLIGGGVPKNFTLQTMLVVPKAYDYAVQVTMDPEATGGLSGATLEEARSWGKIEKDARNASVYGDASIFLPLLVAAAREGLE